MPDAIRTRLYNPRLVLAFVFVLMLFAETRCGDTYR